MILVGPDTFSGVEEFANDMKILQRATIVGERSAGGANPANGIYAIGEFKVFIPEGEAVNPLQKANGKPNWEGEGIIPDIRVPATDALSKAIALRFVKIKS
jgi:C-terminal processing protease CtpA/Prc